MQYLIFAKAMHPRFQTPNMIRSLTTQNATRIHFSVARENPAFASRQFYSLSNGQTYNIKKRLNHPPKVLFQVISNVSEYYKFVPYCTESFIRKYDLKNLPSEAGLKVGFQQYNEEFLCTLNCEDLQARKLVEAVSVSDNLFEHLKMSWQITEQKSNASLMELNLDFQFSNPFYNSLSSIFAPKITAIMLKAFNNRAAELRREQELERKNESSHQ